MQFSSNDRKRSKTGERSPSWDFRPKTLEASHDLHGLDDCRRHLSFVYVQRSPASFNALLYIWPNKESSRSWSEVEYEKHVGINVRWTESYPVRIVLWSRVEPTNDFSTFAHTPHQPATRHKRAWSTSQRNHSERHQTTTNINTRKLETEPWQNKPTSSHARQSKSQRIRTKTLLL